jgi:hypothetical protein
MKKIFLLLALHLVGSFAIAQQKSSTSFTDFTLQSSSPASPTSGKGRVFVDDSGIIKVRLPNGTVKTFLESGSLNLAAPGPIGTTTPDVGVFTELQANTITGSNPLLLNPYGIATGNTGQIHLAELVANGTDTFRIKAPDSLSLPRTWIIPDQAPSNGHYVRINNLGEIYYDFGLHTHAAEDIDSGTLDNARLSSDVVLKDASQTLTSKTLTSPVINSPTGISKSDVGLSNVDNTSDATKNAASATLSNKTLTSPVISTIVNTGTLTLPTSTDTLVGRATTDTLTNKSIDGNNNSLTNIPGTSLTPIGTIAPLILPETPGTEDTSASWVTTNKIYGWRIRIDVKKAVTEIETYNNGNVASQTYNVALYTGDGQTKLLELGPTSSATSGVKSNTFSAVVLNPGEYILAWTVTSGTISVLASGSFGNANTRMLFGNGNSLFISGGSTTNSVLPSSFTPTSDNSVSHANCPWLKLF